MSAGANPGGNRGAPSLSDRVALVTGGSRGIGRAIALRLAATGHPVAVTYVSDEGGAAETAGEIERAGGCAITIRTDVRDPATVDAAFGETAERLGPVLVLVNNAGVRRDALAARTRDDQWNETIATNLTGAFSCTRAAIPAMLRARWGRIVMISSVAGLHGNPGQSAYSASKAGLAGLARTLARELARKQVTVNAVAPGIVETALTEGVVDQIVSAVPAARAGAPGEVAAAVGFLVSDDAAYINGVTLPIDGGLTA